jgi:hypothetical protein
VAGDRYGGLRRCSLLQLTMRSDTPLGCNFFCTKLGVGEQVTMPALAVGAHYCNDVQPITSVGVLINQDTAVEMLL